MNGVRAPGRRQLYAYWRVPAARAEAALQAMALWQQQLQASAPALRTELHWRRPSSGGPEVTVMEVYGWAGDPSPAGLDDAWLQRLDIDGERASSAWRSGARHLEVFERWP